MRALRFLFLFGIFIASGSFSAHACPGCTSGVEVSNGRATEVLAGFSWSVLFLLAAVFVALAGVTALIVRTCRHIDSREAAGKNDAL